MKYSVTAFFEDVEPLLKYEKEIRIMKREPPLKRNQSSLIFDSSYEEYLEEKGMQKEQLKG